MSKPFMQLHQAQRDTTDTQAPLPAEEPQEELASSAALPHLLLLALGGENGSTYRIRSTHRLWCQNRPRNFRQGERYN